VESIGHNNTLRFIVNLTIISLKRQYTEFIVIMTVKFVYIIGRFKIIILNG